MKLIISGAGGFLARNLLEELSCLTELESLIALSRNIEKIDSKYKDDKRFLFLSNNSFLNTVTDLSAYTLINLSYARNTDFAKIKSSCHWTFKLLNKAHELGIAKIINISSQSIYNPCRSEAAKETDLPYLSNEYDMGKYYMEKWIEDFAVKNDILYLNLRIASLVGPDFPQRIVNKLCKEAVERKEIEIHLNSQIFSYTHVRDIAKALIEVVKIENPLYWNSVYNVGSFESYTIEDIAETIKKTLDYYKIPLDIKRKKMPPNHRNSTVDSSRFREITNWEEKYNLQSIVDELLKKELKIMNENK